MGSRGTFMLWRLGSVAFNYLKALISSAVNCGHVAANRSAGRVAEFIDMWLFPWKWSGWNRTNHTGGYGPVCIYVQPVVWVTIIWSKVSYIGIVVLNISKGEWLSQGDRISTAVIATWKCLQVSCSFLQKLQVVVLVWRRNMCTKQ